LHAATNNVKTAASAGANHGASANFGEQADATAFNPLNRTRNPGGPPTCPERSRSFVKELKWPNGESSDHHSE